MEKLYRQAKCLIIRNHLRPQFSIFCKNLLKSLPPRFQKHFGISTSKRAKSRTARSSPKTSELAEHEISISVIGERAAQELKPVRVWTLDSAVSNFLHESSVESDRSGLLHFTNWVDIQMLASSGEVKMIKQMRLTEQTEIILFKGEYFYSGGNHQYPP